MSSGGERGDWEAVVEALRAAADPYTAPEFALLYQMALAYAPKVLAAFERRGQLDDARILDLSADMVSTNVHKLIAPGVANPRAWFRRALGNAALQWLRSHGSAVAEANDHDEAPGSSRGLDARIEAARLIATLGDRERDICIAIARGEDRQDIAAALGISRNAVDQAYGRAVDSMGARLRESQAKPKESP